ncbi:MAG: hypothetical protein SP1CHLAM54_12420 [Chlamydiia bacterium]|nr:hypothetical protein [Chlamydiia bacterium]
MADDPGLFDGVDVCGVGKVCGVVDFFDFAVCEEDFVDDAWSGGDDVEVKFALEAFEGDFEVEEA